MGLSAPFDLGDGRPDRARRGCHRRADYHNASIVEVPRALDRLDIHARLLASDLGGLRARIAR